ncbi:MAG TPA: zinc ribbon domain-containing protein [Terriglobales bacterium]|nr:zinc ribbon domain-containing protein [Terriglobales bacterium]
MPLYEFQCEQCGHRFEKIQSFSAPDPEACPKCGGHVHRVLHAPAVQFKGSGWYVTDYAKSGSSKSDGKSGSSSESSAGSKTETKSESKPESKTKPSGTKE